MIMNPLVPIVSPRQIECEPSYTLRPFQPSSQQDLKGSLMLTLIYFIIAVMDWV